MTITDRHTKFRWSFLLAVCHQKPRRRCRMQGLGSATNWSAFKRIAPWFCRARHRLPRHLLSRTPLQ